MKLNPEKIHKILKSQNILYLYHANTVSTSCTYIEQGGLLSRGAVEAKGLYQTFQTSDGDDKRFRVWDDIFLDTVDLHKWFNRDNHYGPVLFKFSIDILLKKDLPELWITQNNPIHWNGNMTLEERYIQSEEDFERIITTVPYNERQHKMFTLRSTHDVFPFDDTLLEIIIDDPQILLDEQNIFKQSLKKLKHSIETSGQEWLKDKFIARECENCYCRKNYLDERTDEEIQKRFL